MSQSSETLTKNRKVMVGAIGGLAVVVLAGVLIWYLVFRDDSAASVTSQEARSALALALEAAPGDTVDDLDGDWTVDTSIGTFDQTCLSDVCNATFIGFRIDEELARIGAKTVVGRTPGVTGTLRVDGSTITAVEIVADMGGLLTDNANRTGAIRSQAIETASFPEATFVLTEAIDLGSIPAVGDEISVEATGDLTIHGVTRTETIPLTASFDGRRIAVIGELGPMLLADYDIDKPSAAVVLSVEDNAIMELQLVFGKN